MSEKIFLSYANKDKQLVKGIKKRLLQKGIIPAINAVTIRETKDIHARAGVRDSLNRKIQSASCVVILESDNSDNSPWVNYEAGLATAMNKKILVVGRRGSGKSVLFKALGKVQVIDFSDKTTSSIKKTLRKKISRKKGISKKIKKQKARGAYTVNEQGKLIPTM